MTIHKLDPRPFLLALACGHWRQTGTRPTGLTFPCGRSRGCRAGEGARERRILRVVDLRRTDPTPE